MIKKALGIIAGYAVFVITSLLLFTFSGQKPHSEATTTFIMLTAIYGAAFSFISGVAAQAIARTGTLPVNYILALVIAGFAVFSLIKSDGTHWTQLLAILIFAPVSILGGLVFIKMISGK